MSLNPVQAFWRANVLLLSGRMHFPRERIGEKVKAEDGKCFTIFRQVILDPKPGSPSIPGAQFQVRFRVVGMSPQQNKLFSWLPVPFFSGLPGFRSKLWMLDEIDGTFQGFYEWETVRDAENYAGSFAMRFMSRRSEPGSIHYKIIPRGPGKEYAVGL